MSKSSVYDPKFIPIPDLYEKRDQFVWTSAFEPLTTSDRVVVCILTGKAFKHPNGPYELSHLETEGGVINKDSKFWAKFIDFSANP